MPINFSSKTIFIRNIIIKENQSHYFFIGTYNIKKTISYLEIKKQLFDKYNYKDSYSYKLKDIINEKDIEEKDLEGKDNNYISDFFNQKLDAKDLPLKNVKEINCLFGFIKFNMGYYAIFSCDSDIVGKISKNIIYCIDKLYYFPLFDVTDDFKQSKEYLIEDKYLTLVKSFVYDKQLYFSYSYDLTKALQRNFVENFKKEMIPDFEYLAYTKNDILSKNKLGNIEYFEKKKDNKIKMKKYTNHHFCWNYFHMKEFFNLIKNKAWVNFIIYGYFHQVVCNIKGLTIVISIAARRNRNFAGMRYLKRGIAEDGSVANEVETEQIMEEISTTWTDRPKISSFIQIRGSIPLYWYQIQSAFYSKPKIKVNLSDITFDATKRHFASLMERYGHPCIVCNLTKKIEDEEKRQETLLNDWYYSAVKYINKDIENNYEKILYFHYDLKNERGKKNFYKQFYDISGPFIAKTNLFCFIPNIQNKYTVYLQNGVVRTNCIDCLDRTNVFQQILGIAVLVIQLRYIGVNENFPENENENIYGVLTELYIKMGHELANQYTGSWAIKQAITDHRNLIDKMYDSFNEICIAIKRSFINYFIDQNKQNAMNLFLGKYPINNGLPFIWDLPCDEILHKKKKLKELTKKWYEDNYDKYIIFNLFSDIDYKKKIKNNDKCILIEKSGEIYSDQNSSSGFQKNKKELIKMSTTSLLIYNDLIPKNSNNIEFDSDKKLPKITYEKSNKSIKILPYYNPSFSNVAININQYTLDYSQYIDYKLKNRNNKDVEEETFSNDTIMHFLNEVKNRDIRDFNHFEYYNINYIKKNIMNCNNNNNIIPEKQNLSSLNMNISNNNYNKNTKNYYEDFPNIRKVITSRKSFTTKFTTPIKSSKPKSRFIYNILRNAKTKNIKESYNYQHFEPKTPCIPPLASNFNLISPNLKIKYCENPRKLSELKKLMLKLDICSFHFKEDDFKKITEFSQSLEKQFEKKDIYELDSFNTCELYSTEGIFETQKLITEEIQEFDPFKNFYCEEKNKEENENEVDDYIIFDMKKNTLTKKAIETIKKKTNLMPTTDFFPNILDKYKKDEFKIEKTFSDEVRSKLEGQINKDDKKSIRNSEEDNQVDNQKIKIRRIKRLPLKIEDDYFMIKQQNSIEKILLPEKEK